MSRNGRALRAVLAVVLVTLGAGRAAKAGLSINVVPGPGLLANPAAMEAFDRAAAQWETHITDSITVTINADLADLGAGSIIGQASSKLLYGEWPGEIREEMVADAADEVDDGIVALIPIQSQFTALLPPGITLAGPLSATKANLKAMGLADLDTLFGVSDGEITFNTRFAFDYDNRDGMGFYTVDFESAAAHEIGHVLGFVSVVDEIDQMVSQHLTGEVYPRALDVFRFEDDVAGHDPETEQEFTDFPRYLRPGGEAITDQITLAGDSDAEIPMSTGAYNGDGKQASHWKEGTVVGVMIGMMDPTLAREEIFVVSDSDLRALDLIGYDIVVPEPATLVLLGAVVPVLLRRRRS